MLFVGDDWAEGHHDVEIVDDQGVVLARRRLPEGLEGVSRLHALIAAQMPAEWAELDPEVVASRVKVGIETDRGSWVGSAGRGGLRGVPYQPVVGGPLPGAALDLGGEVGCRGRAPVGRDRAARPGPPPTGRRGQRGG